MKRLCVYLDTSVIGGCCDEEFAADSIQITDNIRAGIFDGFISETTVRELILAPDSVKSIFQSLTDFITMLPLTDEVTDLATKYIERRIITETYYEDALHIAFATVYAIDVLVSWNFKHIVNFRRIAQFNGVNLEMGYKPIAIHSPREVQVD